MRITSRLRIISIATIAALVFLAPYLIWTFVEFRNAKNNYILTEEIKDNYFERTTFRAQYYLNREEHIRVKWDASKIGRAHV